MNMFDPLPDNWRAAPTPHEGAWTPPEDVEVTIVCAANRTADGYVFTGARHFDPVMRTQAMLAGVDLIGSEEGFIDQYGRFWNRTQAMQICKIAGREVDTARQGGRTDILFSEGLY